MILAASEELDIDSLPQMDAEEAEACRYLHVPANPTPTKNSTIYKDIIKEWEKYPHNKTFKERRNKAFLDAINSVQETIEKDKKNKHGTVRIDLNSATYYRLIDMMKKQIVNDEMDMFITMDVIDTARFVPKSYKKMNATGNANAAKISKSRAKVQNAINLLHLEGKAITPYAVAKVANISYNTAKKYIYKDKK